MIHFVYDYRFSSVLDFTEMAYEVAMCGAWVSGSEYVDCDNLHNHVSCEECRLKLGLNLLKDLV